MKRDSVYFLLGPQYPLANWWFPGSQQQGNVERKVWNLAMPFINSWERTELVKKPTNIILIFTNVLYHVLCVCVLVTELFANPWPVATLPGSSVYGILQTRILELVAIPFSRGSSWPRDQTLVSCIAGRFFTTWTTREAPIIISCTYHYIFQEQGKWCLFVYFSGMHTKCQNCLHGA